MRKCPKETLPKVPNCAHKIVQSNQNWPKDPQITQKCPQCTEVLRVPLVAQSVQRSKNAQNCPIVLQLPRSVQNSKMHPNWKREKSGTPCSNDQNLYSAANKTSDGVFQFFWVVDCGRCQNKFINCSWDWSQKNQISFSSSSMYQLFLIL